MSAAVSFRTGPRAEAHARHRELAARAHAGDARARDALIAEVQPFIRGLARSWPKGRSQDMDDLVQQGVLGVLHAIRKWDPSRENAFLTYAGCWVRLYMQRAYEGDRAPVHIGLNRVTTAAAVLTRRDRAKSRGLDPDADPVIQRLSTPTIVRAMGALRTHYTSLDQTMSDDLRNAFGDIISDPEVTPVDEAAEDERMRGRVRAALAEMPLSSRERLLLETRLMTDSPRSFEQVGRQCGLSRERMRQVENDLRMRLGPILARAAPGHVREIVKGRRLTPPKTGTTSGTTWRMKNDVDGVCLDCRGERAPGRKRCEACLQRSSGTTRRSQAKARMIRNATRRD